MRYGFTTGSCAAAASKAAAYMLLTGKAKNKITIQTPKGIAYTADITDIKRSENEVSCAVIKDGGDDPDVTTGAYIYASVRILHSDTSALCKKKQDLVIINIDGGDGVGKMCIRDRCMAVLFIVSLPYAVAMIIAAALSFWYYYVKTKKELGGITGDTAGYFVCICECAMAVALGGVSFII